MCLHEHMVAWLGRPAVESTWEPAESLPKALVTDFENGISNAVQKQSTKAGGQIIHTLSAVSDANREVVPSQKRPRVDFSDLVSNSSG